MNPSNYPPGVTGNEKEINGDAEWETLHDHIDQDCGANGFEALDAEIIWRLGMDMWKSVHARHGKFPHEIDRHEPDYPEEP